MKVIIITVVSLVALRPLRARAESAPEGGDGLDGLFQVEPVVVTGRRSEEARGDSPVAVQVIDRAQIASSGARDAAQVLSTVAGVQIESSFRGDAVRLGGLDPQHVLILVDGERLVGARDGAIDLSRFFASDLERIEIVRGPASALYGSDAMAGVINLITRPAPARFEAEALARYGATRGTERFAEGLAQHGDGYAALGFGTEELRGRVAANVRHAGRFDLDPSTPATTSSDLDAYTGQARLDWLPNASTRIPLSLRSQRRNQAAVDESGSGAVYDRTTRTDEVAVVLAPRFDLGERGVLATSASYAFMRNQYARDQRRDDDGDSYEDGREQLGSLRVQHERWLGPYVLATAGVELLGQRFRSPRLSGLGRRGRVSPYGQLDIALTDHPRIYSALVPSVRVDLDSQYGTNVSPRALLRVDAARGLIVRAGFGRGFRAPNFTELLLDFQNPAASYRVEGNPNLEPERSLGADVSLEVSRDPRWSLTIELVRHDVHDLIDTALVAVEGGEQRFSYVNVRRARSQGGEATLHLAPFAWLMVEGTYTLTHARDLTADRDLPGRSRHRGSARLLLGGGAAPWLVSVRAVLAGKSHLYSEDESGVAQTLSRRGYATFDARAAYRIGSVEPFVSGENLTNEDDPQLALRPLTLFVGVTLAHPTASDEVP